MDKETMSDKKKLYERFIELNLRVGIIEAQINLVNNPNYPKHISFRLLMKKTGTEDNDGLEIMRGFYTDWLAETNIQKTKTLNDLLIALHEDLPADIRGKYNDLVSDNKIKAEEIFRELTKDILGK